jgi:hypothetical protein
LECGENVAQIRERKQTIVEPYVSKFLDGSERTSFGEEKKFSQNQPPE